FRQWLDKQRKPLISPIPLFSAWAIPGGPLCDETLLALVCQLEKSLESAGPIDALYLCLHGAMCSQSHAHPELRLIQAARNFVGDHIPICVSLDLHAQLCEEFFKLANVVIGYRTNPHRDHARVGARAAKILYSMLKGEIKPVTSWRSLPMLSGGGTTVDFLPTMRPIYKRLKELEKDHRILYASVFNGHNWHASKQLGWSVAVVADNRPDLAARYAEELADRLWETRQVKMPPFDTPLEAISVARGATLARSLGVICMCDASDVVGAGGTGENTRLISACLEHGSDLVTYAPIRGPHTVQKLWNLPLGTRTEFSVGGQVDPLRNPKLTCEGILIQRYFNRALGKVLVVQVGNLYLVVTEGPPIAMAPRFYEEAGLNIWRADIVIVKSFFPFRLYFAVHNRKTIYVKTKGITDFDIVDAVEQDDPVFPIDDVQSWRAIDAKRRNTLSTFY
ncbi:MAG: hypothetical protein HOK97_14105, partial [Deltaproteobacteria bacterium]|nr:hypothetical protein [Deltaproteobacteria bacterium]